MKLANWKDLDRKELNTVKGFFKASKKQQSKRDVAIDYIDDFGPEFRDNDFIMSLIMSLIDAYMKRFKISDKQAFWLSVAYLTYQNQ